MQATPDNGDWEDVVETLLQRIEELEGDSDVLKRWIKEFTGYTDDMVANALLTRKEQDD